MRDLGFLFQSILRRWETDKDNNELAFFFNVFVNFGDTRSNLRMPHLTFFSIPSVQYTIKFFSVTGTGIFRGKKNTSLSFSYLQKHRKRIICHLDFEAHDNRLHCKKLLLMNISELTGFPSQQKTMVMLCKITFNCLSLNCKLKSLSTRHIGFLL